MFYENEKDCYNAVIAHNEAKTGQEETINDCLHYGMGFYAWVSELDKAGIKYKVKHNALFGHLTKPNVKKLITWLSDTEGYLFSTEGENYDE